MTREVTCAGLVTAGENRHHLVNSGPAMETLSLLHVETDPCQHLLLYTVGGGNGAELKLPVSLSFCKCPLASMVLWCML